MIGEEPTLLVSNTPMTPGALKSLVRIKTRTTAATFPDSEMLVFVNTYKDEIASKIQSVRPEIWQVPAKFNLIAGRREYQLPHDVINRISSLELKLAPDKEYVTAIGLKTRPRHSIANEAEVASRYSGRPHYFHRRKSIYILSSPIETVADGGILTYNSFPADITDLDSTIDMSVGPSTVEHGFPTEFHELLARRVSIAYKSNEEIPLNPEEERYGEDLLIALNEFSAPADDSLEEMILTVPTDNNGYDL